MRIIIENRNYEYYDLNTSDIWSFEQLYFINVEKNIDIGQRIINEIQSLIISNNEPSYEISMYDKRDEEVKSKKFQDLNMFLDNLSSSDKMFDLNFFFHVNTCYEYYADIIINKDSMEESLFQFFFALKLRQYQFALIHIENFLIHQLKSNFRNNRSIFEHFLQLLLRQYPDLFTEEVKLTTNEYIKKLVEKNPPETLQVLSFLLYEYNRIREEYFIMNAIGFAEAFSDLKINNFIHQNTVKEHFKKIFTLRVINPDKRIRWTGRNVELKWFVQILIDNIHKVKPPVAGRWETTLHCFVKSSGEDFEKEETISKASGDDDEKYDKLKEILLKL